MPVVEGYTFAVDMVDRGVTTTLRQLKADASAMKSAMRSGFETIRAGEGDLSAYNFKIEQSQRLISTYRAEQEKLRESLRVNEQEREKELQQYQKLADEKGKDSKEAKNQLQVLDRIEKSYANNARRIENLNHQINRLNSEILASQTALNQLDTGLERTRIQASNVRTVMQAYVKSISGQENAFATVRAQARSYQAQQRALVNQYRSEVAETT